MTDESLQRLHEIERELLDMTRVEDDPAWLKLLDNAAGAVARAGLGPTQAIRYIPEPPGPQPWKP